MAKSLDCPSLSFQTPCSLDAAFNLAEGVPPTTFDGDPDEPRPSLYVTREDVAGYRGVLKPRRNGGERIGGMFGREREDLEPIRKVDPPSNSKLYTKLRPMDQDAGFSTPHGSHPGDFATSRRPLLLLLVCHRADFRQDVVLVRKREKSWDSLHRRPFLPSRFSIFLRFLSFARLRVEQGTNKKEGAFYYCLECPRHDHQWLRIQLCQQRLVAQRCCFCTCTE